jgi:hypothetical protein
MMNYIGKFLVIINIAVSGLLLVFALGLLTNRLDVAWKEPRKDGGERVPAEIDKRTAAVRQAATAKITAEQELLRARRGDAKKGAKPQGGLALAEMEWQNFPLWAEGELDTLLGNLKAGSPKGPKINVRNLKIDNGKLAPNPVKPGRPAYQGEVEVAYKVGGKKVTAKVEHSYATYHAQLAELHLKLQKLTVQLGQEIDKNAGITIDLDGEIDPKSKKARPGLLDLVDRESTLQKQLKFEIEGDRERDIAGVKDRWVQELVNAQLLLNRRQQLEARLKELKAQLAAQGK